MRIGDHKQGRWCGLRKEANLGESRGQKELEAIAKRYRR